MPLCARSRSRSGTSSGCCTTAICCAALSLVSRFASATSLPVFLLLPIVCFIITSVPASPPVLLLPPPDSCLPSPALAPLSRQHRPAAVPQHTSRSSCPLTSTPVPFIPAIACCACDILACHSLHGSVDAVHRMPARKNMEQCALAKKHRGVQGAAKLAVRCRKGRRPNVWPALLLSVHA